MRKFSDTAATEAKEPDLPPTNWLPAQDAKGITLDAVGLNFGDTDYGTKAFLRCYMVGDDDHVEYTISFTDRSYAFQQLQAIQDAETKGDKSLPFSCTVEAWSATGKVDNAGKPVGKSFQLMDAPETPDLSAVKRVKQLLDLRAKQRLLEQGQLVENEEIPF